MRTLAISLLIELAALSASDVMAAPQQQQQHSVRINVTGPLTGFDAQTGAAPARININDMWAQGGPAWDLYVLALADLQAVKESEDLSYFQIMGAHGLPFTGWNDVGQVPGGSDQSGFCPHNQLLFGLWHRPFIALYEQTLVSHALIISKQYQGDEAAAYRLAAESLRVAYWDWAANSSLPEVVTLENIQVNGPNGTMAIRNPFNSYYFQEFPFTIQYMDGGTLSKQKRTTRCPDEHLVDNVARVNEGLASSGLTSQVYNTFTTVTSFEDMETDHYKSTSFESPHNNVHNTVGCANGTMYDLNWSAFDPAFMLHHTNVDRLIALWQAIYPNASIFDITDWAGALYGSPAGNVSADTPLKPFHDQGGQGTDGFHTSRTVRHIGVLGYTYPELQATAAGNTSLGPAGLSEHVRFRVNSLYSGQPTNRNAASAPSRLRGSFTPNETYPVSGPLPTRKSWSVSISVDRAEVPLPATIDYYLGGGGGQQVGRVSLLAIPAAGLTHSSIPLDQALDAAEGVDLADGDEVAAYLNQTLRFEVLKGDGTPVDDMASIPSLRFVVLDRDYTPRQSDRDFPTYGAARTRQWEMRNGRWSLLG